ncbi:hypothetical protein EDD18DRAFT_1353864 [Armillaria luteobubalina]|uniref:Uncharacterized protein n=1 Tax=Armillaria luteobubalina TaxID=153913 RepID=A0AA39UWT2_9AGAR|nr:hypothetical protein EDD18DRAFT_1353864 [Armillaria luteobubalina]
MDSVDLSGNLLKNSDLPCLFLPLSFTAEQRQDFELKDLASMEAHLCVRAAWDLVTKIKRSAQIVDGAQKDRPMARGTKEHMKSSQHLRLSRRDRDIDLEAYNINRLALIGLDFTDEHNESLPELSVDDTKAASMYGLRNLGDSRRRLQGWWTAIPGVKIADRCELSIHASKPTVLANTIGTQDSCRPVANRSPRKMKDRSSVAETAKEGQKDNTERKEVGRLWGPTLGAIGKKTTPEDIARWQYEGANKMLLTSMVPSRG